MLRSFTIGLCAAVICAAEAHAQQSPPPPACEGADHRALDFWIGEWDAYVTGQETLAGRSSIKSEDAGCVITERWTSARSSYTGRSLNLYDARARRWRQFWVDSSGDVTDFAGAPHANGLRFLAEADVSAQEPEPHYTRMTLTPNADGTVRQLGESSDDGQVWSVRYDFTYRRRS